MVPGSGAVAFGRQKEPKFQDKAPCFIGFIRPVVKAGKKDRCAGILGTVKDWDKRFELGRQLKFEEEIASPTSDQISCSGPKHQSKWF